jgi:hypothetical protein
MRSFCRADKAIEWDGGGVDAAGRIVANWLSEIWEASKS